jgi:hypothetical protein
MNNWTQPLELRASFLLLFKVLLLFNTKWAMLLIWLRVYDFLLLFLDAVFLAEKQLVLIS